MINCFKSTDPILHNLLNQLCNSRQRVIVSYDGEWGDLGKSEERMYIGRSTGTSKAPLVIKTRRSMGGSILFDDHITTIKAVNGQVLYRRA